MNKPQEKEPQDGDRKPLLRSSYPPAWILILATILMMAFFIRNAEEKRDVVSQSHFFKQLDADPGNVDQRVQIVGKDKIRGNFLNAPYREPVRDEKAEAAANKKSGKNDAVIRNVPEDKDGNPLKNTKAFEVVLSGSDSDIEYFTSRLRDKGISIENVVETDNSQVYILLLYLLLPLAILGFFFFMLRRTRDQIMGGGFLSGFSKSPAKEYEEEQEPITFADVAGLEDTKLDLQEIIEFLKNPAKFQRLGGRVPKGVLLMGPPGTGKTLLARAVAGEAGVPFLSLIHI